MRWLRKLRALFRREKLEAEMTAEIQAHLDLQTERNIAAGMKPEDARYAALRQFGNVAVVQEQARAQRDWIWFEQCGKDLRYAMRSLRRNPSFAVTAVLTLALGIGVNTALFSAYNTIALRSLPVKDPEMLVKIAGQDVKQRGYYPAFSYADYVDFRDGNHALSDLAAIWPSFVSVDDGSPVVADPAFDVRGSGVVLIQNVSDNYFRTLGADMALGRDFLPEENRVPGDGAVIVLSHLFWTHRMHRNPAVLGSTVRIRNRTFTVIGVAAEGFAGDQPAPPAGWVPFMSILRPQDLTNRNFNPLRLLGRLRPGVTVAQAKADLDAVAARLAKEFPRDGGRDSVGLEPGMRFITISVSVQMLAGVAPVLFGFGMVLLIACTNVANLLLARGITRQQEIGVRLTLGATRGRMLRQLLTENLLLCALAAVVGLAFATWTLQLLKPVVLGFVPPDWAFETRRWAFLDFSPDWRVGGFAVFLGLVSAVGAGLLPALQASHADLVSSLKNDGSALGRRMTAARLRNFLVVAQVAVCLMLLSCAGLLVRNMIALRHPDLGFDPEPVFQVTASLRGGPNDQQSRNAVWHQAVMGLRALPGVASATLAQWGPMLGGPATSVTPSNPAGGPPEVRRGRYGLVTDGFIETFGLRLLRGRNFTADEIAADRRLVVISESAAKRFWPGQVAVGQFLSLRDDLFVATARSHNDLLREFQVIGVVGDVCSNLLDQEHVFLYVPHAPGSPANGGIFLRPRGDTRAILAGIVQQADAAGIRLQFDRRLSANIVEQRLPFLGLSALSGILAGLALLMASVGLYGVMAFSVNQRVREIGIRAALGATAQNIIGLFVRQGARLIAVGIVVGLGAGIGFALLLPKLLFGGAGAFDPLTFGAVTLVFGTVALLACWLPARRTVKVDPMIALRAE